MTNPNIKYIDQNDGSSRKYVICRDPKDPRFGQWKPSGTYKTIKHTHPVSFNDQNSNKLPIVHPVNKTDQIHSVSVIDNRSVDLSNKIPSINGNDNVNFDDNKSSINVAISSNKIPSVKLFDNVNIDDNKSSINPENPGKKPPV